jgi:hypothetical protein
MRNHLRLVVVDKPDSNFCAGACADAYSEYCEAKRHWDRSRYANPADNAARVSAFAALRAWAPDTAALYGNGSTWGFN